MLYQDIEKVIRDIGNYLNGKFGESFKIERSDSFDRYVVFKSENLSFRVMVSFIQARVQEDFTVPIENRLADVFSEKLPKKGSNYILTSRLVETTSRNQIPFEYCLLPSDL